MITNLGAGLANRFGIIKFFKNNLRDSRSNTGKEYPITVSFSVFCKQFAAVFHALSSALGNRLTGVGATSTGSNPVETSEQFLQFGQVLRKMLSYVL